MYDIRPRDMYYHVTSIFLELYLLMASLKHPGCAEIGALYSVALLTLSLEIGGAHTY